MRKGSLGATETGRVGDLSLSTHMKAFTSCNADTIQLSTSVTVLLAL